MESASLKCPECGFVENVGIPGNACMHMRKCAGCGRLMKTPKGFCCIICAYSDRKCPYTIH